ncbi:DUF4304 domain-containing protein [Fictibacillus phosphorivorans]|nr:DUF4304 domain-containing protein [Fictibacillus phosphorivorans]
MIHSLKRVVIPSLRERGFKGSFPHYYRRLDEQTHLLMFQFSMHESAFFVEISKCSSEGYQDETTGAYIPSNKIKVYQIGGGSPYIRTRIGKDAGFPFGFTECNHDEVGTDVLRAMSKAEDWWKSYPNWWNESL